MARAVSILEKKFIDAWTAEAPADAPAPVREYAFCPGRRWRFDFAWPEARVAVEVQGGTWVQGGHSRGAGHTKDAEKLFAAALMHWRVFYVTTDMLRQPKRAWCFRHISKALRGEDYDVNDRLPSPAKKKRGDAKRPRRQGGGNRGDAVLPERVS